MENNIYASPEADLSLTGDDAPPVKLYSPTQVALGTLGGPVGLMYFLMSNFRALKNEDLRQKTLYFGIALIVALIAVVPFLPDSFPSSPFTILYIVIARFVAEKYQMTKAQIAESKFHEFHSNWRVLGYGILCLAGSLMVLILPLTALSMAGVWVPSE